MICKLLLIGLQAFNPCEVVAVKPVLDLVDAGWGDFTKVETDHCYVFLNNGGRNGIRLIIEDMPCPVVTSKINQQLRGKP